jgi:hypothetical protein
LLQTLHAYSFHFKAARLLEYITRKTTEKKNY